MLCWMAIFLPIHGFECVLSPQPTHQEVPKAAFFYVDKFILAASGRDLNLYAYDIDASGPPLQFPLSIHTERRVIRSQ